MPQQGRPPPPRTRGTTPSSLPFASRNPNERPRAVRCRPCASLSLAVIVIEELSGNLFVFVRESYAGKALNVVATVSVGTIRLTHGIPTIPVARKDAGEERPARRASRTMTPVTFAYVLTLRDGGPPQGEDKKNASSFGAASLAHLSRCSRTLRHERHAGQCLSLESAPCLSQAPPLK